MRYMVRIAGNIYSDLISNNYAGIVDVLFSRPLIYAIFDETFTVVEYFIVVRILWVFFLV